MNKSIAIDMDGVLADVEQQFLDWYHRDFGIRYDRNYLIGKDNHNAFHEPGIMRKFVVSPGFFLDIPVMTGAVEAVQKLMEKYEVYIVSAAMEFPLSLPEKLSWLNLHFPFIGWKNIIF
jgi:5'-nucleotidase